MIVHTAPRPSYATAADAARAFILADRKTGIDRGIFEEVLLGESKYFAVMWEKQGNAPAAVRIVVAIVRGGRHTWFVQYRDESSHPRTIQCPPWLIDVAGDPPDEAAAAWRAECRAFYDRMALPMGTVIAFKKPVSLPDGRFETRFRFIPGGREERCFVSCCSARAYAIPDFAQRRWSIEHIH
jgi:hypothetical protein